MILPGEVKDAEMSSFSSDFQTLKHFVFTLWIIDEFEKCSSPIYFPRNEWNVPPFFVPTAKKTQPLLRSSRLTVQ